VTAPSPSRALCPVEDCQHEFDLTVPSIPANALAEVFGFGVMAAVHQNRKVAEREQELGDHFRTHTTAELVRSIVKANQRLAAAESTAEDLHDRLVKLARLLNPQPGDLVKGWIDEGGSAQGVLLSNEEAVMATEVEKLPTYYAAIKTQPAGNVVVVMRESLRGVES
jgi:hypothetical protein